MGFAISGDNATCPGQIAVAGTPTAATHVARFGDVAFYRDSIAAIDLNASAPSDLTALTITKSSSFIPIYAYVHSATANLATAELGIYTASGAGGTAIVTPAALSNLTASGKFHQMTIASLTDPITATTLYPRLTVAAGTAGTVTLVLVYLPL